MTTAHSAPVDVTEIERLSRQFADVFDTFEASDGDFAPDAFFDLNMPVWRFQLEGAANFATQLKQINEGPVRMEVTRTVPTVSGFVTEHVEHQQVDGEDITARRIWLCEIRDGRIAEATGYCSGEWNEELRARHAAEAPMIRP
jgi:hypothetical protein